MIPTAHPGPHLLTMAKYGGTLVADTNTPLTNPDGSSTEDMNRQSISIINLDHSNNHILFVEFGGAASTTLADGSWAVHGPYITLHVDDYPEIRGSINLKSASTTDYIVRTS